ncbi:Sensor histidine kinase [Frankia sp. AgKG'84/4]
MGTSGWSYDHWSGVLYPPGTPPRRRLDVYVRSFDTVELNASFYRWPKDAAFRRLRSRLPTGFELSVKAARGLTHGKRLREPEVWVDRIAAGWHELGDRRAVLLVQLAPGQVRDDARLEYFLGRLPWWLRVAVELRHPSWHTEPVFEMLARHQAAYCVMSGADLPCVLEATAPFVYVRLHGPDHHHLYGGSYGENDLRWWADRVREWLEAGHDTYVYFNNDGGGHAVNNARRLRELLDH